MHHQTLLPNGLRVVTAELPHAASVAVGIWVGVGGRHEPASLGGISHFIEHLLFKGTRRRTAGMISEAVEGVGGYLNAFTDEEHTCFYARAHATRFPILLDVLADMFLESRLDPVEIDKERTVILDELAMYRDQPADLVHDVLNAVQFPGDPLGRPVIGTRATLRRLGRADFTRYLRTHYVAGATVIAVAGNLRHEEVVRRVRRLSRRFRPGARPIIPPARAPRGKPAVRLLTKASEQTNFGLGVRAASRHDPRRHALRLLNVILGENMSSRLFQVVREEHGLTYNIQSSLTLWEDTGDVVISAGLDTAELERTLRLIVGEMNRLRRHAPPKVEVRRARDYVLGQFDLSLESTEHHMMWLGEQWVNFGSLTPPAETRRRISAVTPGEIRSAACDFLAPHLRSLALVSPRKQIRGLLEILSE
jgi:predicted Zn-dependent peptidase